MILFDSKKLLNVLPLIISGFYFGILQTALYFAIEVYVTATFIGYFLLILAWMCGVIFALKVEILDDLFLSMSLSLVLYYLLLLLVIFTSLAWQIYPLLALLIFASAFPAGKFFKLFGRTISSEGLFFHENNGFAFGTIVSLLLFVKFGVHFIYAAPIIAFLIVLFSLADKEYAVLSSVFFLFLLFIWQNYWVGVIAFLFFLFVLVMARSVALKQTGSSVHDHTNEPMEFSTVRLKTVIFIAGINLILLQYFIVREFSTIISANELSILIVSAAYFLGFSVGYALSSHITFNSVKILISIAFLLHLVILAGIKFLASYFVYEGYSLYTILLLLSIASFLTSSFYSILLPKIIRLKGASTLAVFYSTELAGASVGILLFLSAIFFAPQLLLPIYFLLFVMINFLLLEDSRWANSFLFVGIYLTGVFTINQNEFRTSATLDYYQSRGYTNPTLLYSGNSFYHTLDIIETFYDRAHKTKKSKISFINGQKYFDYKYSFEGLENDETSLSEFTYFLAGLPAQYQFQKSGKKQRILILGGGSLYSINRVAPFSSKTTLVEIDPVVIESSKKWWSEFNKYDKVKNYEIIIDDAKHYLKGTDEQFDLIIMDISAPYYLGSALLHNKEFFELVKSKLKPGGVFSESTQGRPDPHFSNETPMKILKAVHDVFSNYLVIDCKSYPRGKRGFIMASDKTPILSDNVVSLLQHDEKLAGTLLYNSKDHKFNLAEVKPFSLYSMENLLANNLSRIKNRMFRDHDYTIKINFKFLAYLEHTFLNLPFIGLSSIVILLSLMLRFYPNKESE